MTVHNWQEDELFGRYEVALTVDVGSTDAVLEATRLLREFATTLPVLGHSLQSTQIIGLSSQRAKDAA